MITSQTQPFGKLRNLIWPIHTSELKKLIPMFMLFFLIAFVYNLLHCLKVSLIVTAEGSGAEVIPFLQIGAILPAAIFLTYIYTKLISIFNREKVFYIFVIGFLLYFALFTFVLYPNHKLLQLDSLANLLKTHIFTGSGATGFIMTIKHLNLTLFYVLSEMWSVVVFFMLFWGFANEVTKIEEAKRFYAIFALGANCSGIISGEYGRLLQRINFIPAPNAYIGNEWLSLQLYTILLICCIIILLFWWLNKNISFHNISIAENNADQNKTKITLTECFSYLRNSRYLTYMMLIVVGYYIVYNLSDIMWAYKIGLVMKSSKEVNAYMSRILSITGVISVILALLVSGNVIRKFGWTVAAILTPMVWILTSIGFFSSMMLEKTVIFDVLTSLISNHANLVLLIGSIQICLGRSCKYTVFDETKEIAFIPLSQAEQRKSKVIIDGLASRVGKSGGAIIYIVLFYFFGDIANVVPYIAVIMFIALTAWLYATIKMGGLLANASQQS